MENVVNVDFPLSPAAYVHRVGRYSDNNATRCGVILFVLLANRTARGDEVGTALSLVAPNEEELLQRTEAQFTGGAG